MAAELNSSKVSSFHLQVWHRYEQCQKLAVKLKSISAEESQQINKSFRRYLIAYYELKTDLKLKLIESFDLRMQSAPVATTVGQFSSMLKSLHREVKASKLHSFYYHSTLSMEDLVDRVKTFQMAYTERSSRLMEPFFCGRDSRQQRIRAYFNVYHSLKFNLEELLQSVEISEKSLISEFGDLQKTLRATHRQFKFLKPHYETHATSLCIPMSELSVEKIPAKEWANLAEMVDRWYLSAHLKYFQIHKEISAQPPRDIDPGSVFLSAQLICDFISGSLHNQENIKKGLEPWNRVVVCRDGARAIQAIALFEKEKNSLAYLVTHPDNIRHPINENIPTRAQGAGTQIILYLARSALKKNVPLRAVVREDAELFYQKLHFDDDSNWGTKILTVEKIKQLIVLKTFPFNFIVF
jgi:hypothetical protein